MLLLLAFTCAHAQDMPPENPQPPTAEDVQAGEDQYLFIREYRIKGATVLPRAEVEKAVYPYLGPYRTPVDVGEARRALERLYHENGYQTATVSIPEQEVKNGVVVLQVTEGEVGRLRVTGSRFYDIEDIKEAAPSVQEGVTPNFNEVVDDMVALNQYPGRTITPELGPGARPGTVDIDLVVEDEMPLSASLELNNRYSADTHHLRLNGSASYDNLWQRHHTIGGNFQTTPEDLNEVFVYGGYYIFRFRENEKLSLMLNGTKQDSNVSTAGGIAVAGRGTQLGATLTYILPPGQDHFHSISGGVSYKDYEQEVRLRNVPTATPILYYPFNILYSSVWGGEESLTELYTGVTMNSRNMGSSPTEWDNNRFEADGAFLYWTGELARTQNLPRGFQVYARAQGQLASGPLISNEQFAGGGLETVRGYLEAEVLGDNAVVGNVELRAPSLIPANERGHAFRPYLFADYGYLTLRSPLPQQESRFSLASFGAGARAQFYEHISGAIVLGVPLYSQQQTDKWHPLLTFLVRGEL